MTNLELIKQAESALNSQKLGEGFFVADVGCALISENNEVFTGACIGGSLGLCAEQSAFSNLLSKHGPKIKKIVAVWKNEEGDLHILPPCGRCREFMRIMSQDNLETEVILETEEVTKLKDLLPYHGWYATKVNDL